MFYYSQIDDRTLWTSLLLKLSIFIFVYMCLYEYVPCVFSCLQEPVEGVRSPGAGLMGGFKLPSMSAENRTQIL